MATDWLLWQLADSAFPSGGFAHSGGLEAAVQLGHVNDSESFERFARNGIIQITRGVGNFTLPAWESPAEFTRFDHECDLFLNNHVANRASRAQGHALLASAAKAFAETAMGDSIARLAAAARQERMNAHFAPVFGVMARALEISSPQTADLFLFIQLRGYISAAVRLGIVGPMQAQQIQARLTASRDTNESVQIKLVPCDAVQTNPMLDLLQMTQDRLYSRLFQS